MKRKDFIEQIGRPDDVATMIRIPKDDLHWLKSHALDEASSVSKIIRELISKYRQEKG